MAFIFGCRAIEKPGITEQSTLVIQKKMTMTEEQLQELIARICEHPDSQSGKWRRDVHRLLVELQRLPGLLKYSHSLYLEALDQTWEWVSRNICTFEAQPNLSIHESLVRWINGYLYWRIKDLDINQAKQHRCELSLDFYVNESSENPLTLLDTISENGFDTPTLNGLDDYIEQIRNLKIQEVFEKLELYVEEDPEQIFQNCHPRKHHDCNCQLLCKRLLFKDPPDKFAHISQELGINYQALNSHWKRKCLLLLQKKLKDLGYLGDEE